MIDCLVDLARRSGHRLMVRLVKGAYWDSEIKRAQVDGLDGYPVYTRKVYTDVSYLACARKLLAAPDAVFPQFATHNAQTLAADPDAGRAGLARRGSTSSSACTAWASRCTRRWSARAARPPLPHLRAGRHARDAAGLSGAAPAGERRQLLVRQPHRRPRRAARRTGRRPGATVRPWRARCGSSARRIRPSRCRATLLGGAARANSRGLDLADERTLAALAAGASRPPPPTTWQAAPLLAARHAAAGRLASRAQPGRCRRRRGPGARGRRRPTCRRRWRPQRRWPRDLGGHAARRARRAASKRPPISWRPTRCDAAAAARARGRQDLRQRRGRGARGGRLPALLRGRGAARLRQRHATGRWGRSSASARGTFRSRSSPARWPRRWPPATRCSPSRPSRRR